MGTAAVSERIAAVERNVAVAAAAAAAAAAV